jgi:hypothetical protein
MGSFDDFMTPQFWVTCVFINAVVELAKRLVAAASPKTADKAGFRTLLTLLNPIAGLVCAIDDDFLFGKSFSQRALVGVGAGLVSLFVYNAVLKRIGDRFGPRPAASPPEVPKSERKTPREVPRQPGPDEQSGGP